jgi:hypothetical protein
MVLAHARNIDLTTPLGNRMGDGIDRKRMPLVDPAQRFRQTTD